MKQGEEKVDKWFGINTRMWGLLVLFLALSPVLSVKAEDIYDCANGVHRYEVKILSTAQENMDGIREYTCSLCGYSYKEPIPMYGHVWGEWVIEKAATCQEDGKKYRICIKYEHTAVKEEENLPKTAHEYGAWRVRESPSKGRSGIQYKECIYGCGEKIEKQILPLPVEKTEMTKSTPVKQGWTMVDGVLIGSSAVVFIIFGALFLWDLLVISWYLSERKKTMEKVRNGESLYGD